MRICCPFCQQTFPRPARDRDDGAPAVATDTVWAPTDEFLLDGNLAGFMRRHGIASYDELERAWIADPDWFWLAAADDVGLTWLERPSRALDPSRGPAWPRWYADGTTNLVHACVRQHPADALALLWEGEEGAVRRVTFGELDALVGRIAGGLRALGVGPGDRVGLFLPLTPEAVACCYACAALGAIYVPAFSGYGADAVAVRLADAGAKVLITADAFLRRGRRIDMRAVAEAAAARAPSVERVVVMPRLDEVPGWDRFLDVEPFVDLEPVAGDHPFMVAYTSGTTGRPKGAVHTHASWPVRSATETAWHLDQRPGEPMIWMTDLGWIMAALSITGCHLTGRPLLLYDGAPDHPAPSRMAEVLARHEVGVFGTSPTYIRSLMGRDDHGFDGRHASLRLLSGGGEPWTEPVWRWYFERVGGGRIPLINQSGGTEAGAILASVPLRPIRPCTFNSPAVGVDANVFAADGRPAAPGALGELVVLQPWVGQTKGFWADDDSRYEEAYWSRWPGVWAHGDLASRDADGHWLLHGRSDDTLMIAGKRVGPAEVEAAVATIPGVRAAAAVGLPHETKGEALWCFIVARGEPEGLEDEVAATIVERLGKPFAPERVVVVAALPQTRNAKILRRAIRAAACGIDPGDVSALENPEAVEAIAAAARGV